MITESTFIRIVRDDLKLPLNGIDLTDGLPADGGPVAWDSLHVLRLVAAVEKETGHRMPVGPLLADKRLGAIFSAIQGAVPAA
ncbi:acyl carrier protein [Streptacidiphilus fuscans]|uniref:Acyl carrier protein n=1 Tax=Streptacidiphilus fuscans TaxID=2789292 RepID=A0A931B101_9ACTN|nr:acyl carrier protein [Streptacidiphilus fuscans]MBF9068424.1 acyl carrier protein [Streptacidiphilus fuscans]